MSIAGRGFQYRFSFVTDFLLLFWYLDMSSTRPGQPIDALDGCTPFEAVLGSGIASRILWIIESIDFVDDACSAAKLYRDGLRMPFDGFN